MVPLFRRRKYRDISLPPQWSPARQGPVASIKFAETFEDWMAISNVREARHFLETHRELLRFASEILIGFSLRNNLGNAAVEYEHLDILREIKARGNTVKAVKEAYIDIYNGLEASDIPPWLENLQNQLLMIEGNPLQQALACIEPLRETIVRAQSDPSVAPEALAALRQWLGIELFTLPKPNLSEIAALWQAALTTYTLQRYPRHYASLQSQLGRVYLNTAVIEQNITYGAENIIHAIACFSRSLQVYTRNEFPEEWARSQAGLGVAYAVTGKQKRAKKYLEHAIEVFIPKDFPEEWGFIQEVLKQLTEGRSSSDVLKHLNESRKMGFLDDETLKQLERMHHKKEF